MPKAKIIIVHKTINAYLPSLPFILKLLNLSESNGIRVTISTERDKDKIIRNMGDATKEIRKADPE